MAMLRIGQGVLPPRPHMAAPRPHRTPPLHQGELFVGMCCAFFRALASEGDPLIIRIRSADSIRQLSCFAAPGPPAAAPDGSPSAGHDPVPLVFHFDGNSTPSAVEPAAPAPPAVPTAAAVPSPLPPPAAEPAPPMPPPFPACLPTAPWTIGTTLTVMAVWLICFYVAAYDVVPFFLRSLGYGAAAAASQPGVQALRHLLLDATQLGVTLLLLRRALAPHAPRALGLFAARLRPLRSWLPTVAAGAATFPAVDFVHKQIVALLAGAPAAAAPPAAGNAAFLSAASWEVRAAWFLVLAVCAPLWEEIMFRGFLLPSLARYVGPAWAVAASSLVFATVHFTQEGFVPLLLLGGVFGGAYLRTRNLVPAVALHSMWNVCLLTQILTGA